MKDFWLRFIGEKVSLSIFCGTNAKETKFFVLSFAKTGEKFRRILTFTVDLCYNVRRNQAKVESSFRFGRREVVIRINDSPENIETCEGNAVEDKTTRTCALCVALNDTVFKNDNKPAYRIRIVSVK